ncbi:PAP2 superfamily protein [Prevotella aff. ruminicola Tc2-24]|uniref:PAP2 superfamily protein n=1 Tax=Prevotella aff. ruminicola Tc2-24 TaxID=81582 RepID=A0A1I0QBQ8_9BACT|nr:MULTISPECIES: phosphatase PAP2 family protein [Prevotella]SEE24745.1 PAP2 superfamily protein [Prevotella sp. lc2012]SEW24282.1 PAP2 superfamily protein [Prevotella aff. ruminicola Tc2-24]
MKSLRYLFEIEKKPKKGLLTVEWVILGYLALTLLIMFFTYTKVVNPESMLWGRIRIVAMTIAMWAVYRMLPCRFTHLCRIIAQMALLSWWYPDTYEFNRMFPNLDHLFAGYEQQLFNCQPALLFSKNFTNPVLSELMHLGYASYYPLIALVTLFYFFYRYKEFSRTAFIILTAFFVYYVIFIALPVTGPQYYYLAAGMDNIANGVFPNMHDFFATHSESLPIPGYRDGFFYQCVVAAHDAGERPTAAFPSSHVGICTILLFLAWRAKNKKLFYGILPFFVLMCFATVYIQAHYAVDVIGGWVSAAIIYMVLCYAWRFTGHRN